MISALHSFLESVQFSLYFIPISEGRKNKETGFTTTSMPFSFAGLGLVMCFVELGCNLDATWHLE